MRAEAASVCRPVIIGALVFVSVAMVSAPDKARAEGDADHRVGQSGPPATTARAGPSRAEMRDTWLTAKTKIALFADERVKSGQISVETVDAVVNLRGKVDTPEARAAAIAVTRRVDGVRRVQSDLHVVPPAERGRVDATDKTITRRVDDALSRDRDLREVKVRTDQGVVILTGEVPNIMAGARASERARGVAGVRAVKNQLYFEGAGGDRDRSVIAALILMAAMSRKSAGPAVRRDTVGGGNGGAGGSEGGALETSVKSRVPEPGGAVFARRAQTVGFDGAPVRR